MLWSKKPYLRQFLRRTQHRYHTHSKQLRKYYGNHCKHQKRGHVPFDLLGRTNTELENFPKEALIKEFNYCYDKTLISPIKITVTRYQSTELSLDLKNFK